MLLKKGLYRDITLMYKYGPIVHLKTVFVAVVSFGVATVGDQHVCSQEFDVSTE
jgi:hypothetical protein